MITYPDICEFIFKCDACFDLRGSGLDYEFLLNVDAFKMLIYVCERNRPCRPQYKRVDLDTLTFGGHPVRLFRNPIQIQLSIMPKNGGRP